MPLRSLCHRFAIVQRPGREPSARLVGPGSGHCRGPDRNGQAGGRWQPVQFWFSDRLNQDELSYLVYDILFYLCTELIDVSGKEAFLKLFNDMVIRSHLY
jgi:hypothetical protein